jgi:hypothetical protein
VIVRSRSLRSIRVRSVRRQAMRRWSALVTLSLPGAQRAVRLRIIDAHQPGVGGLENLKPSKSARPDMDKTKRAALRETGIDKDLAKRARLVVRWFCRRARRTSDARQCPWQH